MINFHRVLRSPSADRNVLLQALLLLPITFIALRTLGFRRWQAILAKLVPSQGRAERLPSPLECARRVARMVQAASEHGLRQATCLERAQVLWWFLQRRGMPASLRIGVRKSGAEFEAHVWVDLDGMVLNDNIYRDFLPFQEDVAIAHRAHR